ncbi:MAG: hypothetical protein WC464_04525 [Bdellovibrionales bacterium]
MTRHNFLDGCAQLVGTTYKAKRQWADAVLWGILYSTGLLNVVMAVAPDVHPLCRVLLGTTGFALTGAIGLAVYEVTNPKGAPKASRALLAEIKEAFRPKDPLTHYDRTTKTLPEKHI